MTLPYNGFCDKFQFVSNHYSTAAGGGQGRNSLRSRMV